MNIKLPSILPESVNLPSFLSFPAQMVKLHGLYTDERSLTIKIIPGKLSEKNVNFKQCLGSTRGYVEGGVKKNQMDL